MTDLHACYFCGDVGEHGAVDVVPTDVAATPDEQVTVRLCETCHPKLTHLIDPLVERVRGSGRTDLEGSTGATGVADDAAGVAGDEVDSDVTSTDGAAGDGPADDGVETGNEITGLLEERADETDEDSGSDGRGSREAGPPGATGAARNGHPEVTFGPTEGTSSGSDADGTPAESAVDADTADDAVEAAGGDGGDATGDDGTTTGEDATNEPGGEEATAGDVRVDRATFRKVMRLLANREFPVVRSEVEDLASSAYDLDESDVEAIVDAAVERGLLREEGRELHRS